MQAVSGLDFVSKKLADLEKRLVTIEGELRKKKETGLLDKVSLAISDVIAASAELKRNR